MSMQTSVKEFIDYLEKKHQELTLQQEELKTTIKVLKETDFYLSLVPAENKAEPEILSPTTMPPKVLRSPGSLRWIITDYLIKNREPIRVPDLIKNIFCLVHPDKRKENFARIVITTLTDLKKLGIITNENCKWRALVGEEVLAARISNDGQQVETKHFISTRRRKTGIAKRGDISLILNYLREYNSYPSPTASMIADAVYSQAHTRSKDFYNVVRAGLSYLKRHGYVTNIGKGWAIR